MPRLPTAAVAKLVSGVTILVAAASVCLFAFAAGPSRFSGRLAVEVVDGIEFNHQLRLIGDFAFVDRQGGEWLVRKESIVDDEALPREWHGLSGLPYVADYRKAAVVYGHFRGERTLPWKPVLRMFHEAAVTEGLGELQAAVLYAAVYAGGWRWEPKASSCFRSCHGSAPFLAWKPAATSAEIQPVLDWIAASGPGLDEIDARLDAAIARPGPHLFAQRK